MKTLKIAFAALILFSVFSAHAEPVQFTSWDQACAAASAKVAEGDLIFLDIPYYLFRHVATSTMSWTSHVGVVFKKDGEWIVSESTTPRSKDSSLCDFLQASAEYRFQIKRFHAGLNADQIKVMRETALSHMKKIYDFNFDFDSKKRMFCSKFAYLIYQSVGISAGRIQTFGELIAENPEGSQTFWKTYFLGSIPVDRRTVTPANQNRDPQFDLILDSL